MPHTAADDIVFPSSLSLSPRPLSCWQLCCAALLCNFPLCVAYTLLLCWGLWQQQHVALPAFIIVFAAGRNVALSCFFFCFASAYCYCCSCCSVCRHHQRAAGTPLHPPLPPPLPDSSASACFCRFLVFNIHLKLSCPLLAPGCSGSPAPLPISHSLPPSTVLRVLFLHSDYVDCSAVPVDPSLLIVCLTEWLNGERDKRTNNCRLYKGGRGSWRGRSVPQLSAGLPGNPYDLCFYPFI